MWLEMGRVDRGIFIVPGDEERSSLHVGPRCGCSWAVSMVRESWIQGQVRTSEWELWREGGNVGDSGSGCSCGGGVRLSNGLLGCLLLGTRIW